MGWSELKSLGMQYIMGSELMENDDFSPSICSRVSRQTAAIGVESISVVQTPINLTGKSQITLKIIVHNTGTVGIGISATKPTTLAQCMAIPTKQNQTGGTTNANSTKNVIYDISSFDGEYYLFAYTTGHKYVDGVVYWKVV